MKHHAIIALALAALSYLTFTNNLYAEGELSASVTFTTDYAFDGVSQSDKEPALQGSFEYADSVGYYLGIWASTINYGDTNTQLDETVEIDFYVGWGKEINDKVSYDTGIAYYTYPGIENSTEWNYPEVWLSLMVPSDITFSVFYAYDKEVFGDRAVRGKVIKGFELGNGNTFTVELTRVDRETGLDYNAVRAGIARSKWDIDWELFYNNTSIEKESDPAKLANERIGFSGTYNFDF